MGKGGIQMKKLDFIDFDNLTDEEIDEFYRPQKMNSRKSLAPLFVYLILQQNSNFNHPLSQKEILAYLESNPYEITIERKALSRIIHNLCDSDLHIQSEPKIGTWCNN